MELKINGEKVDFTLEKEAVLSEVVKGVEDWLAASGYLVTGIAAGSEDLLSVPRDRWARRPISEVPEIRFRAGRPADMRIEHWMSVRSWLGSLQQALSERSAGALAELFPGIPAMIDGLRKNPAVPGGSSAAVDALDALFRDQTADTVKSWAADRTASAVEAVSAVREELAKRIAAVTHPAWIVAECVEALTPMAENVSEISLLLQTGKDGPAMERIIGFSEIAQKLLDIVPFLPPDRERDGLFKELLPVLRQLVEAFGSRDLVLIGDLFEYEVAPRLTGLLPALRRCL